MAIINQKKVAAPEVIEKQFQGFLWNSVRSFMRDQNLRRLEQPEGLYNIALMKLYDACRDFVYEDSLSQQHNELRFISLLKTYVRNALIDEQYAQNTKKRAGNKNVFNFLDWEGKENEIDNVFDPEDRKLDSLEEIAHANELRRKIERRLDSDDLKIFSLFMDGYPAEKIAGRLGILIPRVRHALYARIQPVVSEVTGRNPNADDTRLQQ